MAVENAPAPEAPKGPDTLGDPTLIEADETLRRISEMEDKNLILKLTEGSLKRVTEKIGDEQKKTPADYEKLQKLSDQQQKLTAKRDEMLARADKKADASLAEVSADMNASAKEMESDLGEMKKLQDKQTALNDQLTPELLASENPADIAKRTAIYADLKEVAAALKKYEKAGTYEEQTKIQEARVAMHKKAEEMEKAEREQEEIIMERDLQVGMAEALGEPVPDAKEADKKDVQADLTDEQREEILDNKIDQIAFDLATMLAGNVPKADDTIGKFSFEAKRGLLMVMTFLGGDPSWAMKLSPDEQKALGMTVTTKLDDKGETVHNIKWEPLDLSLNKVQDVYEVAFGAEGWTKEMGELTDKTTVKELQTKVDAFPPGTTDPKQLQMIKFVAALREAGATDESGVKAYIEKNSDKIIKILKPKTAAPDAEAPAKDAEGILKASDVIKIITDNNFNNSTSVSVMLKAVDKDIVFPEKIEGSDPIKTVAELTVFANSVARIGKAAVALRLPDDSLALKVTFAKASTELSSPTGLTPETKAELRSGIDTYFTTLQAYTTLPYAGMLRKLKQIASDDSAYYHESLTDIDAELGALEKNSGTPTATDTPAAK